MGSHARGYSAQSDLWVSHGSFPRLLSNRVTVWCRFLHDFDNQPKIFEQNQHLATAVWLDLLASERYRSIYEVMFSRTFTQHQHGRLRHAAHR